MTWELSGEGEGEGQREVCDVFSAFQDAHDNEVSAICFNTQGSYMATGGADKVVKVWTWREAQGVCYSAMKVYCM